MWEHWRETASNTFQRTGDSETGAGNKNDDGSVEEIPLSSISKEISTAFQASTYREFKEPKAGLSGVVLARRQAMNAAKDILDGWVPNDGDEGWGWRWNMGELFDVRGNPVVMDPKGSKKRKR
jgi:tRNA-specific adenosine deaminase 1